MRQYEVWWADFPAPVVGRRPVLLLTRSAAYGYLNKAIVAEITATLRGIPQEVPVGEPEGLAPSVANFDNIHVVAQHENEKVKRALGYALDWRSSRRCDSKVAS
jgi:mRNA-degrading endonuclease toxin of MazEF toxin-antitoxin module